MYSTKIESEERRRSVKFGTPKENYRLTICVSRFKKKKRKNRNARESRNTENRGQECEGKCNLKTGRIDSGAIEKKNVHFIERRRRNICESFQRHYGADLTHRMPLFAEAVQPSARSMHETSEAGVAVTLRSVKPT